MTEFIILCCMYKILSSSHLSAPFLAKNRSIAEIFQRENHIVSNRGYTLDCYVDLHAMFYLQKRLIKGDHGHPEPSPLLLSC